MRKRFLDRRDWTNVRRKRYIERGTVTPWGDGREAFFIIDELERPVVVQGGGASFTISDEGYSWYQLAITGSSVWLSAAFDAEFKLIELYFDITDGNDFSGDCPSFTDMYLDIALSPEGNIRVLDRDELDAALNEGVITQDERDRAARECEKLYQHLTNNRFEVLDEIVKRAKSLRECLEKWK